MLGGYNEKLVANGTSREGYGIHWFYMIDEVNNSWEIRMEDARYGYESFVRGKADRVKFSAGHKFMYVPSIDFDYLAGLWEDKIATVNCESRDYCFMKNTTCADIAQVIGPLKIQFSTLEYFSVEPETYLFDGKDFNDDGSCVFGVFKHQDSNHDKEYILGSAFL
jgi:hypothetical protein